MQLTKLAKKPPRAIAESILENLETEGTDIEKIDIAGPGFMNNGADLNAIKAILGHSSLAATQVYTHSSMEQLKSIYKQAHPRA